MFLIQKLGTVSLLAIVDANGIVTKETKYGDSSRILTVITKNLGKISVLAGSVRRGKSGLLTATSIFSYSHFTLFKSVSSSLYKLNEGELITAFSSLRESLEKMAFASYICDVTNSIIQEYAEDTEQFELLLRCLYMLSKNDANHEKIKAIFEFRTLTITGLLPNLSCCGQCGSVSEISAINPLDGSVCCKNCLSDNPSSYPINKSILSAISYISVADEKKIFSFDMSDNAIKYLSELGEKCVSILLDKNFKTLEYLRRVTALG